MNLRKFSHQPRPVPARYSGAATGDLRQTGRTTRMLAEADAAIARGENVAIVVAPHFTHRAHELACIAGLRNIAGARFICAGLDMSLEHARGFPGTLFVDHLAAGEP